MSLSKGTNENYIESNVEGIVYKIIITVIIWALLIISLMYLGFQNYLLFHSILELFSVLIASTIFIVTLNSYKDLKNNFFSILGIGYGFVMIFDLLHVLTYEGMGIFAKVPSLSNICTQLWISARYIESITLLIVGILFYKNYKSIKFNQILWIYAIISGFLILSIFQWHTFPECLIDSSKLTNFKILSEYLISFFVFFVAIIMFKGKKNIDHQTWVFLELSLIFTILSELSLTLYNDIYGIENILGHIFKTISFYFTYKSVVEVGLRNPYRLLAKDLKKKDFQLGYTSRKLNEESYQRMRMEEILIENQECYDLLIQNAQEAIAIHSGGKVIFVNELAASLIGDASKEEIIGKSLVELLYNKSEGIVRDFDKKEYSKDLVREFYETQISTDNGIIDIEVKERYLNYKNEPAVLCLIRNITKDKEIEKLKNDVKASEERLNETLEVNRIITEFLGNISHEMKTPLNVILGSVQVLDLYNENDCISTNYAKNEKYLKIMRQNCYRILRLINNFIDISKIDSGFYNLNLHNYNIVNIVEEITLSVVEYVENKGVNLIFDTDVEEKILACDPDKIERIILNLLSNSVKFTNPGDEIWVTMIDKGNSIVISVKDSGIGIPEDKLKVIFERFGQVNKSMKRNHEGSGIGLSLVKSLIEMHDGTIDIRSSLGEGSEFIIRLPVKVLTEEEAEANEIFNDNKVERIHIEFADIYE